MVKCTASGLRPRVQEHVESEVMEHFIVHEPVARYIINTHAFHNAHLLHEALPRTLVAPMPVFENREAKHHELASLLRVTQENRRDRLKAARATKKGGPDRPEDRRDEGEEVADGEVPAQG